MGLRPARSFPGLGGYGKDFLYGFGRWGVFSRGDHLDSHPTFYDTVRPHRRLNMATPMECVAHNAA